jgi:hypothetical protein
MPKHHDAGPIRQQGADRERLEAALKATADAPPAMGSLARQREDRARRHMKALLNDLRIHPALKLGRELTAEDVRELVEGAIEQNRIPRSLQPDVREAGLGVIETMAGGDHTRARTLVAEASVGLGRRLAKSTWNEDADDDGFDPRAVAARADSRGKY